MIDWQRVCLNLRTHYKSLATVAKEIGSNEPHLQRLARGDTQQPRFDVGVRLLDLHSDKCADVHRREILMRGPR